jgi:hypothetical protein
VPLTHVLTKHLKRGILRIRGEEDSVLVSTVTVERNANGRRAEEKARDGTLVARAVPHEGLEGFEGHSLTPCRKWQCKKRV